MVKLNNHNQPKFQLGKIVATPGALELLNQCHENPLKYLIKHIDGDWGELSDNDIQMNNEAIAYEGDPERMGRILSSYRLPNNEKLWVITEADRSSTCILLPEEY